MKHEFTLIIQRSPELTDELSDALFAAGCDDGSPGSCNGVLSIDFHREAPSLAQAIRSAIADVRTTGLEVERIELSPDAVAPTATV